MSFESFSEQRLAFFNSKRKEISLMNFQLVSAKISAVSEAVGLGAVAILRS
jgi:hypothetical protein